MEKKYGQSSVFVTSTLQLEDGGTPRGESYVASLFKEAIHVISCGYEAKTEWGKEVSISIYTMLADENIGRACNDTYILSFIN